MSRRNTRVAGHALPNEGRIDGWPGYVQNGPGATVCSCGLKSPELESTAARKRWHAEHKQQVQSSTGGETDGGNGPSG